MSILKTLFILLAITIIPFNGSIANISTTLCNSYWWKEAPVHNLEDIIIQEPREIKTIICDDDGNSPFHLALMFTPYKEVIKYLLDLGFSIEDKNQLGQGPLELASMNENPEILGALQSHSHSNWYKGVGVGGSLLSQIIQSGNNRDTTCYPDDNCFTQFISPGRLWFHNVNQDTGVPLEFFIGKKVGEEWRFEIAFTIQQNNLDQGIDQYSKEYLTSPDTNYYQDWSSISSNTISQIDDITTNTLSINWHYDLEDLVSERVTPNIGFGIGVTHINIDGIHFSTDYQSNTDFPIFYAPALSLYNSRRTNTASDLKLSYRLHAGLDFNVTDRNILGLRFTFADIGSIDYEGYYSIHSMHATDPNFSFNETFHGIRNMRVMFVFTRR